MSVDKEQLVAWLRERAERHGALVIKAVYLGLVTALERGDFDEKKGKRE